MDTAPEPVAPVVEAPAPEPVAPVVAVEEVVAVVEKVLTEAEKYKLAVDSYFTAIRAGDKKLAAQIHADNKLPYSVGNHS